uniref:Argininosuccinate lyase n=1 Tax=Anopheles epiroticus TaxID=199890 RepID=A0A182PPK6_9DIPT
MSNRNNRIVSADEQMQQTPFKLWGGRYSKATDHVLSKVNNSLTVDKRLYAEDIDGSIAYAKSLCEAGLLTQSEFKVIVYGLDAIRDEWTKGTIKLLPRDEDVHTVNERRLFEIIGPQIAGKLHTGRSRNEQVVVDMKLWMRNAVADLQRLLLEVVRAINDVADRHIDVLMPGYTHMQRAQPVRFSHWLLSYAFYFREDFERFEQFGRRMNVLPLGSGALAGNPFNINRHKLADDLGFDGVSPNSMNVVSDRDFVVEFNFLCTLVAVHMSRLAEDLILYSTKEYNFIELSEEYTTGSSLMPQKRNPDSLELIRGMTGPVFGQHCAILMTLKGLPSTYNKDLQGDKSGMFAVYDQMQMCLVLIGGIIQTMRIDEDRCLSALGYEMLATDMAYYLVRRGIPFREAHHISGEVVAHSEKVKIPINKLTLEDLQEISPHFDESISRIWNYENSVEQYTVAGGTSRLSVQEQIRMLRAFVDGHVHSSISISGIVMDVTVEDFCEETNFPESPCPSPFDPAKQLLNIGFLQINGRFTPHSGPSSVCSTRSCSLATTPVPPDANEPEDAEDGDKKDGGGSGGEVKPRKFSLPHLPTEAAKFEISGRATPVFTWNPMPTSTNVIYALSDKNQQIVFSQLEQEAATETSVSEVSSVVDSEAELEEDEPVEPKPERTAKASAAPKDTDKKEMYPNCDVNVWLRSCEQEIVEPIEGKVQGTVPEWLNGSLLRNGPGSLKVGDMMFNHLFDSSALLHRFNIDNGKITYQCRFLKSDAYKKNNAARRIVVTEFGTSAVPDPCQTIFQKIAAVFNKPGVNNSDNAMISIYPFGDEFFAFTESPIIHRIDPETLDTEAKLNVSDYVGIVNHTSHPHVMSDGTVYNLGCSITKTGPAYTIICFPHGPGMFENARIVASVPARWKFHPGYMHTFGITENFFVIVEQPLSVSVPTMVVSQIRNRPMAAALKWFESQQTYIYLLDRDTGELRHTFHTEPFFYLHIINQYEREGHVVLDICCYKDPAMLNCMYVDTMRNMQNNPDYAKMFRGRPLRFVLPLDCSAVRPKAHGHKSRQASTEAGGSWSDMWQNLSSFSAGDSTDSGLVLQNLVQIEDSKATAYVMPNRTIFCKPELLCDLGCETPRIYYERHLGRPYRYFYAISSDVDASNPGTLIKVDVVTKGKLTWCEENVYPSEPIFVPAPDPQSEDDGVVLAAMVWGREEQNRAGLLVLDAKSFTELGRCEFVTPGPVPKCLHGWFQPSAK